MFPFKELCELIEQAGYSVRSYSGRGMYGQQCLGIDTEHTDVMAVSLDLVAEYLNSCNIGTGSISKAQDLCELLKGYRSDSMGKGYIIYWPGITWEESEEMPELDITPDMLADNKLKHDPEDE